MADNRSRSIEISGHDGPEYAALGSHPKGCPAPSVWTCRRRSPFPYAALMRRLFSSFAHGAPGIGLLLLRLATGSALIYHGVTPLVRGAPFEPAAIHTMVILPGLLLLAGLWTPIAGFLVALASIWEMVSYPTSCLSFLWIAIIGAALALLGPGAWSVDARLYGWKQIKISDRKPSGPDSAA